MEGNKIILFQVFSIQNITEVLSSNHHLSLYTKLITALKGGVGSADLKISKSALLFLNHHNFSNTNPIYTE